MAAEINFTGSGLTSYIIAVARDVVSRDPRFRSALGEVAFSSNNAINFNDLQVIVRDVSSAGIRLSPNYFICTQFGRTLLAKLQGHEGAFLTWAQDQGASGPLPTPGVYYLTVNAFDESKQTVSLAVHAYNWLSGSVDAAAGTVLYFNDIVDTSVLTLTDPTQVGTTIQFQAYNGFIWLLTPVNELQIKNGDVTLVAGSDYWLQQQQTQTLVSSTIGGTQRVEIPSNQYLSWQLQDQNGYVLRQGIDYVMNGPSEAILSAAAPSGFAVTIAGVAKLTPASGNIVNSENIISAPLLSGQSIATGQVLVRTPAGNFTSAVSLQQGLCVPTLLTPGQWMTWDARVDVGQFQTYGYKRHTGTLWKYQQTYGQTSAITLTTNVTSSSIVGATAGMILPFLVRQDSTGGRSFAWPSVLLGTPTVSSAASTATTAAFCYDGANAYPLGQTGLMGDAAYTSTDNYAVVPCSSALTFDVTKGLTQRVFLTSNISSSTLTGASAGQVLVFMLQQDSVGGRTFAWPANFYGSVAPSTAANTVSTSWFYYDGVNAYALNTTGMAVGTGSAGYSTQPFASSLTLDFTKNTPIAVTLTGNVTASTLTGAQPGQLLTVVLQQDQIGGRTIAWPTNFVGAVQPSSVASTISTFSFIYDGVAAYAVGTSDLAVTLGGYTTTPCSSTTVFPIQAGQTWAVQTDSSNNPLPAIPGVLLSVGDRVVVGDSVAVIISPSISETYYVYGSKDSVSFVIDCKSNSYEHASAISELLQQALLISRRDYMEADGVAIMEAARSNTSGQRDPSGTAATYTWSLACSALCDWKVFIPLVTRIASLEVSYTLQNSDNWPSVAVPPVTLSGFLTAFAPDYV